MNFKQLSNRAIELVEELVQAAEYAAEQEYQKTGVSSPKLEAIVNWENARANALVTQYTFKR